MDRSLLQEELVSFVADVLSAAVERMGDRLDLRLITLLSNTAERRAAEMLAPLHPM